MDRDTLKARILEIAREELRLDDSGVQAISSQDLARHLDSVQRLTLVVAIEDEFEVCLDPDDEEGLITLDDAVALIANKVGSSE